MSFVLFLPSNCLDKRYHHKDTADKNRAEIAHALVEIVIKDVSLTKNGFTAEQIVVKIESGPITRAILEDLLQQTKYYEMERLLMHVIPQSYMALSSSGKNVADTLSNLSYCYLQIFSNVNDDTKRKVTNNLIRILRGESKDISYIYLSHFFAFWHLRYATNEEVNLAKTYIFSVIKGGIPASLCSALSGISEFLNSNFGDAHNFASSIIATVKSSDHRFADIDTVINFLCEEDFNEETKDTLARQFKSEQESLGKDLSDKLVTATVNYYPF